jgi:hypothetical protein
VLAVRGRPFDGTGQEVPNARGLHGTDDSLLSDVLELDGEPRTLDCLPRPVLSATGAVDKVSFY